jgi:hypothetical protein
MRRHKFRASILLVAVLGLVGAILLLWRADDEVPRDTRAQQAKHPMPIERERAPAKKWARREFATAMAKVKEGMPEVFD